MIIFTNIIYGTTTKNVHSSCLTSAGDSPHPSPTTPSTHHPAKSPFSQTCTTTHIPINTHPHAC